MIRKIRFATATTVAALSMALAAPSFAQSLEEIVVTARKREENLKEISTLR